MITWKGALVKYSSGTVATLGDFAVGGVYFDGINRGDNRYYWACKLPGFRERSAKNYATEDEARAALEGVIMRWVERAGLEVK